MAAAYQAGYRLGIILAGAGALFVAQLASWQDAYLLMATSMLVGMVTVLVIDEPDNPVTPNDMPMLAGVPATVRLLRWIQDAFIGLFAEFFRRNGQWAFVLMLFIGCYRITDMVLGVTVNPFYIDIGFSLAEIASVTKLFGTVVTLFGAAIGGVAVARYGFNGPLVFGAVILAVTKYVLRRHGHHRVGAVVPVRDDRRR